MATPPSLVSPPVKAEPIDDDDLVLSYLNADCVSMDLSGDIPSPPYSSNGSSTSPTTSTASLQDPAQLLAQDPLFSHWQQVLSEQALPWPASTAALANGSENSTSCSSALPDDPLLAIHPLMVPPPPLPFLPALALPSSCPQQQRSLSMSAAAMGDDESPAKKKRHSTTVRKSRDIAPAPLKPLAPVKLEAMPEELLQPQHRPSVTPAPSVTPPTARVSPAPIAAAASASPPADTHNMPEKSPAETAYAKRQERLIKNRAAALLSRKRKREHLTALEQDRLQLQADNDSLKQKVLQLESRVQSLENENTELKRKFALTAAPVKHVAPASLVTPKHAKTTGMVFMIILFSFALFTLPSSHTRDQLTVGGSPASPSMPLIGASTPSMTLDELPAAPSTDLMLINSVRPGDLQTWIQTSMDPASSNNDSTDVIQWYGQQDHADEKGAGVPPHLYLYANELAQVTPLPLAAGAGAHNNPLPESTLSLLCPLNTSSHCDSYLQIDVKVLGSSIKHGVLRSDSNKNAIVVANHPRHHNNDPTDTDDMLMTEQPHRALRRKWADKQRKRVSRIVLE